MAYVLVGLILWCLGNCAGAGDVRDNMVNFNINTIKNRADVILIGKLESIPPPFETLRWDFYKISTSKTLKGPIVTNGLIVVESNVDSSEGSPPEIEQRPTYMLFLQDASKMPGLPARGFAYYRLVGNWKGILSLDKNAQEYRAVRNIENNYGIKVNDVAPDFIEALEYSLKDRPSEVQTNAVPLSKGAATVFEKLRLSEGKGGRP